MACVARGGGGCVGRLCITPDGHTAGVCFKPELQNSREAISRETAQQVQGGRAGGGGVAETGGARGGAPETSVARIQSN
jgi:hypothetical protein